MTNGQEEEICSKKFWNLLMYKIVFTFIILAFFVQFVNFLKLLSGPEQPIFGIQISGWLLSLELIPSLVLTALIAILLYNKNAASFWVYLTSLFLSAGNVLGLTIPLVDFARETSTNATTLQLFITQNSPYAIIFAIKLLVCWMMWRLLKRGELKYSSEGV